MSIKHGELCREGDLSSQHSDRNAELHNSAESHTIINEKVKIDELLDFFNVCIKEGLTSTSILSQHELLQFLMFAKKNIPQFQILKIREDRLLFKVMSSLRIWTPTKFAASECIDSPS